MNRIFRMNRMKIWNWGGLVLAWLQCNSEMHLEI